jgi:hypothetical protein
MGGRRNRREQPGRFVAPRSGLYQFTFPLTREPERPVPVKLPPWIGPAECGDPEAHLQLECGCWCDCTGTWHRSEDCP